MLLNEEYHTLERLKLEECGWWKIGEDQAVAVLVMANEKVVCGKVGEPWII